MNFDMYESVGTHWIALYVNGGNKHNLKALELNAFQKKSKNL